MASIEPIDDMEDVQMEEGQKEKEKVVDPEQPTNAEGKQENKKQETVEGGNKVSSVASAARLHLSLLPSC